MKIYPHLRLLWISSLISTVAMFGLISDNQLLSVVTNSAGLVSYGLMLIALRRLSDESVRFSHAFICNLFAFALSILSIVVTLFNNPNLLYFATLLLMTGSMFSLVGEYQLYWALDERIIPQGYVFPARRIRLCFYLPLLGAFISSVVLVLLQRTLLSIAIQIAAQIVQLVLLFQYMTAVRNREDDPLSM